MAWWCTKCGRMHENTACPGPQPTVTNSEPGTYVVAPPQPDSWGSVRLECIRELGYALVYMNFLNPWPRVDDLNEDMWHSQRLNVQALCEKLSKHQDEPDVNWWGAFLNEIRDEIENMC